MDNAIYVDICYEISLMHVSCGVEVVCGGIGCGVLGVEVGRTGARVSAVGVCSVHF